jgi:hypothetical protein
MRIDLLERDGEIDEILGLGVLCLENLAHPEVGNCLVELRLKPEGITSTYYVPNNSDSVVGLTTHEVLERA